MCYEPAEVDLLAPAVRRDPFPYFAYLRREAPVLWVEQLQAYLVSRYEDVARVARKPELFSSIAMRRSGPDSAPEATGVKSVITVDPPEHGRLRSILQDEFRVRPLRELEPRVQVLVEDLVACLQSSEAFDLVRDFTIPLPVTVIAELLDIEPARHEDFKYWSDCLIKVLNDRSGPEWERARAGVFDLIGYFREVLDTRSDFADRQDILSVLLRAERESRLDRREIVAYSILLLTGGNETTTNLIGGMVVALLRNPDQLAMLRDDPSRIPNAIEEGLRYCSPVQAVYRRAMADVEIAGVRIPRGRDIAILLGAANHDPARFPDPECFDITRHTGGHVGFGIGVHHCLGAHLGRLETRVAFEHLLPHLDAIAADVDAVDWSDNWFVRGPERLPFHWH